MKLEFEKWYENQEEVLPTEALELFKESVLCYKVGANRSAFLMAFNGFHVIIVKRVSESPITPNGFKEKEWNIKLKQLTNEDKRDSTLLEIIGSECSTKKAFPINDQILREYKSLRDIRNICAHGKKDNIDSFRIEQLWHFIQKNLPNFTIIGEMNFLLEQIKQHYDYTLTPPNKEPQYLIDQAIYSIPNDKRQEFLRELSKITCNIFPQYPVFNHNNKAISFWNGLLQNQNFHNEVLEFIKQQNSLTLDSFVIIFQETVGELIADKSFARLLWTKKLYDTISYSEGKWLLLKEIITQKIVSDDEQECFGKLLFKYIGFDFPENYAYLLKETNYFKILHSQLFEEFHYTTKDFYFLNEHSEHIRKYLNVNGLDEKIIKCFNLVIPIVNRLDFFYMLSNWFSNSDNLKQYQTIAKQNNLSDYSDTNKYNTILFSNVTNITKNKALHNNP